MQSQIQELFFEAVKQRITEKYREVEQGEIENLKQVRQEAEKEIEDLKKLLDD